jgi:uncharacterized membrane protein
MNKDHLTFYLVLCIVIIIPTGAFSIGTLFNNGFGNSMDTLYGILILFCTSLPIIIYLKYGREPEIQYNGTYERDLPTNDSPAIVNAICGSSNKIGKVDLNGFKATILDLINRKYLILNNISDQNVNESPDSIYLKINRKMDQNQLWEFEAKVIFILEGYEENGHISLDLISDSLYYNQSAKFFHYHYKDWQKQIKEVLLTDDKLKQVFSNKGDNYLKFFGMCGLILGFGIPTLSISTNPGKSGFLLLCLVILGIVGLFCLVLPSTIGGQWTPYGREYCARWKNFANYMEDYSLIKEYSPKSINIWNKYLAYATALGVAENVQEDIEFYIPHKELEDKLYLFKTHKSYKKFRTSMNKTKNPNTTRHKRRS